MTVMPKPAAVRLADTLAVYFKARVLIVLFLGFSAGLPLALSSSTLLVWVSEAGVDLRTIGLFAFIGRGYRGGLLACARRCALPGERVRGDRVRQTSGLGRRLSGDGSAGHRRHCNHAPRNRAEEIPRRRRDACGRKPFRARRPSC